MLNYKKEINNQLYRIITEKLTDDRSGSSVVRYIAHATIIINGLVSERDGQEMAEDETEAAACSKLEGLLRSK